MVAVEDHPKYADWSAALDRLTKARDEYQQTKSFGYDKDLLVKEQQFHGALQLFRKLSDELDG